jgi:hypothetical protein
LSGRELGIGRQSQLQAERSELIAEQLGQEPCVDGVETEGGRGDGGQLPGKQRRPRGALTEDDVGLPVLRDVGQRLRRRHRHLEKHPQNRLHTLSPVHVLQLTPKRLSPELS